MRKNSAAEQSGPEEELNLKKIMEVLGETDVCEFEYSKGDMHIVLKKEPVAVILGEAENTSDTETAGETGPQPGAENTLPPQLRTKILKSPAVGTFHISERDTLLASVGKKVKKGRKLGWVNSMGIMQEIMADADLKIGAVFCKDREVVEWGQKLFEVEEENV
ncbi:MAG: biotin/lipoyl-containing protein [Candidatus Omnitrophota bacterium]|nr:hypothetical protein [Candidatus Omnitrophota bacterium]MBU2529131.1 hypothetical protein [bacterium]MBU3929478.1 hypothetical protein [bacterium]MBU4122825.1 hypothetical protein [bacterium]